MGGGASGAAAAFRAAVLVTMTEQDILLNAANDIWPEEPLNMAQQLLWYKANELYRLYKSGALPKDAGIKRKTKIISEFRYNNSQLSTSMAREKHLADFWVKLSSSAINYAKNKSIDNADAMYFAMYGMIPSDIPIQRGGDTNE